MAQRLANSSNSSRSCSISSSNGLEEGMDRSFDNLSYTSDEHDYSEKEPILNYIATLQPERKRKARNALGPYRYRVPNRVMRYLCLGLAGSMLVLMFGLMRASADSDRLVLEMGKSKPAPPMPWKAFTILERYYGGLRSLTHIEDNIPEFPKQNAENIHEPYNANKHTEGISASVEYRPYPDYSSAIYLKNFGEVHECFLDKEDSIKPPMVRVHIGVPMGMPNSAYGSHETLGLNNSVCMDRYGRYSSYGYGYGKKRGGIGVGMENNMDEGDAIRHSDEQIDYTRINWANAQRRCVRKNLHRFIVTGDETTSIPNWTPVDQDDQKLREEALVASSTSAKPMDISIANTTGKANESVADTRINSLPKSGLRKIPRQAVVIRTWDDFEYIEENMLYLRSIINELSLASGGEFDIHFLIQVKNNDLPIWADDETYQQVLKNSLPREFQGLGTLWSERQMQALYSGVNEALHKPDFPELIGWYRSAHMPLQYFSKLHPEYEHIWNWEIDVRYTGNWYELFSNVGKWASKQPRKGLWERNNRFYIPSLHGSWDDFVHMVRVQSEMPARENPSKWANMGPNGVQQQQEEYDSEPVWGPRWPEGDLAASPFDDDPSPPTSYEKDKYEWGVGEEADLILFNPIFDPVRTGWGLADDINGYNLREDGTNGALPPRRTAVIASGRFSKRLLDRMHREVARRKHTMFTEMFPPTMALHHGLKAVYAPHPVFMDRDWPMKYLAATFNPGPNGESGRHKMTVFGECCQHNLIGSTWHYNAEFAPRLWKRWWGVRADDQGGEADELQGEGRMCLPPMLLHPIKNITLPVEVS